MLEKRVHYAKSPITEAVIDIQLDLSPNFAVESLLLIGDLVKDEFPTRDELMMLKAQIVAGPEVPKTSRTQLGYRYRSTDGKYILQARMNGFTFSRLQPYINWESFCGEARKAWQAYKKAALPIHTKRVAVRYVNRIDIPLPMRDLSDYLKTFPQVSSGLPQTLNGYLMQLLIPEEDFGGMLSLIQASVPAPAADISSINLDIDLFKESATAFAHEEDVWVLLEHLRNKKNEVFESCITDKCRQLFKPE